MFAQAGFHRVTSASGKEFRYEGVTSDFDDIFILENTVIVCEYTTANESNVSSHLKSKKILYDKIQADNEHFLDFLTSNFDEIKNNIKQIYSFDRIHVRIVYASRFSVRSETKEQVPNIIYLDYNYLRYFANLTDTVRLSSRYEILDFLSIKSRDFGENCITSSSNMGMAYEGSVLPEANSHFPKGFKVVSFYVDAAALLQRAYVLRRDGWRSGSSAYQRMIGKGKVEAIRKHILDKSGVFVNNIIVTLPTGTKLIDINDNTIPVDQIRSTVPGRVRLAPDYNSICLIDGQHRVFSYHEGGSREPEMAILRKQQNLLVTGIMFPPEMNPANRAQFEAKLFLEINSNQSSAKSELKQEIGLLLKPFSTESIAKQVINYLNDSHGPLRDHFGRYFYDTDKLKTTTVVSYGLKPLVRISQEETLFSVWNSDYKIKLVNEDDSDVLMDYIEFCGSEINIFISAVKANISNSRWTTNSKDADSLLTTTFVNGLISCFRLIVKNKMTGDFSYYQSRLKNIDNFDFKYYKSSQYFAMGEALHTRFFAPA